MDSVLMAVVIPNSRKPSLYATMPFWEDSEIRFDVPFISNMEDEIDYMSDEFITNCVNSGSDVRPGLIKSRKEQREHDLKKKELANIKKPSEILQAEAREESLKKPINSSNKGFSMLEKMGFKTGMGLGKNNTGIKEPIGLHVKKDKVGLGHQKKEIKKTVKVNSLSEDEFRAFMSNKNRQREVSSDLRKSQKLCKELDLKVEKTKPDEVWFWPEESDDDDDEVEEEEEMEEVNLSEDEKLEILTRYLRQSYYYCIWCKVQFEDEKDMEDCPGPTRNDH